MQVHGAGKPRTKEQANYLDFSLIGPTIIPEEVSIPDNDVSIVSARAESHATVSTLPTTSLRQSLTSGLDAGRTIVSNPVPVVVEIKPTSFISVPPESGDSAAQHEGASATPVHHATEVSAVDDSAADSTATLPQAPPPVSLDPP